MGCRTRPLFRCRLRRDRPVLAGQHHLDQPDDSRSRLGVTNVGLGRPTSGRVRRIGRHRARPRARPGSTGSPARVPVPWASTRVDVSRVESRRPGRRAQITRRCPSGPGRTIKPPSRPSLPHGEPRESRETRSPSASAAASGLNTRIPAGLAAHEAVGVRVTELCTGPRATTSAARVGDRVVRIDVRLTPPARAIVLARPHVRVPPGQRPQARRARRVDRQAGPRRSNDERQPARQDRPGPARSCRRGRNARGVAMPRIDQ